MKTLFLHIGYNKTGTSSIQHFLKTNQEVLKRSGICYPTTGIHNASHYGFSKKLINRPPSDDVHCPEDLFTQLAQEIKGCSAHSVIISSEYFAIANPQQVLDIKEAITSSAPDYVIKPVVYLRRHDLWFESMFNQDERNVPKPFWDMDIRDYIISQLGVMRPEPNYGRILDRWAKFFGQHSLIVRPFEQVQFHNHDLIEDFFHACGLEIPKDAIRSNDGLNESIDSDELLEVSLKKRSIGHEKYQSRQSQNCDGSTNIYGKLSPIARFSIYHFFKLQYGGIAQKYLGQENSQLFMEAPEKIDFKKLKE